MSGVDVSALADHLEALARAAQVIAEDLRIGLGDLRESGPADARPRGAGHDAMPELMTANDVADALRLDIRTLRRKRQEGKAPKPLRGKGPLRWRRGDVERWIEEGRA